MTTCYNFERPLRKDEPYKIWIGLSTDLTLIHGFQCQHCRCIESLRLRSVLLSRRSFCRTVFCCHPYVYSLIFIACLSYDATCTVGHLVHAFYRRTWFLLPTIILAGVGEILGWTGRLWSSKNVLNNNAFMIQ